MDNEGPCSINLLFTLHASGMIDSVSRVLPIRIFIYINKRFLYVADPNMKEWVTHIGESVPEG
jgi:hypothetical protein